MCVCITIVVTNSRGVAAAPSVSTNDLCKSSINAYIAKYPSSQGHIAELLFQFIVFGFAKKIALDQISLHPICEAHIHGIKLAK